jgi:hypothetical protein
VHRGKRGGILLTLSLLDQYEQIPSPETNKEAIFLVASMMQYRMSIISGLECEIHLALVEMRAGRNARQFQRTMTRVGTLMDRVRRLALDNQYDADNLASILRSPESEEPDTHADPEEDVVRYIN